MSRFLIVSPPTHTHHLAHPRCVCLRFSADKRLRIRKSGRELGRKQPNPFHCSSPYKTAARAPARCCAAPCSACQHNTRTQHSPSLRRHAQPGLLHVGRRLPPARGLPRQRRRASFLLYTLWAPQGPFFGNAMFFLKGVAPPPSSHRAPTLPTKIVSQVKMATKTHRTRSAPFTRGSSLFVPCCYNVPRSVS